MKRFSEFVVEASDDDVSNHPDARSLMDKIGPKKFKAVIKHPWFFDYFRSHVGQVGYRYRKTNGIEYVDVAHSPIGEDRMKRMVQFQLNHKGGKVDAAHLFHNWNDERYEGGDLDRQVKWKYIKSHKQGKK